MQKQVFILRGVPGCGKSTLADTLLQIGISSTNCCADDWFMQDGEYKFDFKKLGYTHLACQHKFETALLDEVETIVVSNTSTRATDVNWYRNKAMEAGYRVTVLTVENWHNGIDLHNVSDTTKEIMKGQLLNSIKL